MSTPEKIVVLITEDLSGGSPPDMRFTAVRKQDTEDETDISGLSDAEINAQLDAMATRTGFGMSADGAFHDLARKLHLSVKDLEKISVRERYQVR